MKLKLELYKEINIFWGLEPNKKTDKTVVHVSPSTLEIIIKSSHCIFEILMGVVG